MPQLLPLSIALALACTCRPDKEEGSPAEHHGLPPSGGGSAPTARIEAPLVGAHYYSDQPVDLLAWVSDEEDGEEQLSVSWSSSLDGELGLSGRPGADGRLEESTTLSEGLHVLTLTATDLDEQVGSDSVEVEVGPPNRTPPCAWMSPGEGEILDPAAPVELAVEASDPDVGPALLSLSWSSDLDGDLGPVELDAEGLALAERSLSPGWHSLRAEVVDEAGLVCEAHRRVGLGLAPEARLDSSWAEATLDEGSEEVLDAWVSDELESPAELELRWWSDLDGELAPPAPGADGALQLPLGGLSPGLHVLHFEVTDSMGLVGSDQLQLRVNGLPSAPVVALGPEPAFGDDDLVVDVVGGAEDPEGGAVELRYAWYLDGVVRPDLRANTVPADLTARGQEWRVVVTAADERAAGAPGEDSLVVANRPPSAPDLELSPAAPAGGVDDLRCEILLPSVDADDDPISYAFTWAVDGVSYTGLSTAWPGDTVPAEDTALGQRWVCTATPHDGLEAGAPASAEVEVGEVAGSLRCNPSGATAVDRVSLYYSAGLPAGTAPRTLEAWVRVDPSFGGEQYAFTYGAFRGTQGHYLGLLGGYSVVTQIGSHFTGAHVGDGAWHHLASTFDGSVHRLYVDGLLSNSGAMATDTGASQLTVCGTLDGESKPFYGWIDEVRLWDHARSDGQIAGHMDLELEGDEAGLLVYYDMNQPLLGDGDLLLNRSAAGPVYDGEVEGSTSSPAVEAERPF
jgi:hypothetical protein